jgi:HEAT repeat protein
MNDQCRQLIDDFGGTDYRKMRRAVRALKRRTRFPCLEAALRDAQVATSVKRGITELLYELRWPEAVTVLVEQVQSSDPHVRANAAEAIGAIGDVSAGPALLPLLDDLSEPTYVRDTAAFSLGLVGYHPAWRTCVKYLSDPERTVRYCCAKALSFFNEPESRRHLEEALESETEEMVRMQLQETLRTLDRAQTA